MAKPLSYKLLLLLAVGMSLTSCRESDGMADSNSLEWVPFYYRYLTFSQKKADAARFLLDGMPYHTSAGMAQSIPAELKVLQQETDALYASIISGYTLADYPSDSLRRKQDERRPLIEADTIPEAVCDWAPHADAEIVTPRFLIRHINNAFRVWKRSPFARELTFDEFKEYILPYRCIEGYGFLEDGKEYARWFGKYVRSDTAQTVRQCVEAYNKAIGNMRWLNGRSTREKASGIYDLYTNSLHDCVDVASYGCNILRACGVPTVVEYNVCYRNLSGRHYHCALKNAASGEWETFNPESSLPGDGDWAFAETMNVYRQMYGAQKDTPWFLRAEGESVPPVLSNPCIRDVTSRLRHTVSITMPCSYDGPNNLVYLATFNRSDGGVLPVTWGVVDKAQRQVTFPNAIPDAIYVLVCTEQRYLRVLSAPFFITDEDEPRICAIPYTDYPSSSSDDVQPADTLASLVLTRKYPRKPNMVRLSEELVGSRVLGANRRDFSDAVTLLEVRDPLPPCFLDYPLEKTGNYQYYRFQASEEHPHANISMLEWVTEARRGYTNTLPATRPHILQPADTMSLCNEGRYVKLLDDESWEKMSWKAEYDGNMQTAPGAYPNITLWLKEPQEVTHVRMAPKNADNGIQTGDEYELLYWEGRWKSLGTSLASYEYVEFQNVPCCKLYWLRNLTRGKEEIPFVLDKEENLKFIYSDIINQ